MQGPGGLNGGPGAPGSNGQLVSEHGPHNNILYTLALYEST